jgi:hypothetical protein
MGLLWLLDTRRTSVNKGTKNAARWAIQTQQVLEEKEEQEEDIVQMPFAKCLLVSFRKPPPPC